MSRCLQHLLLRCTHSRTHALSYSDMRRETPGVQLAQSHPLLYRLCQTRIRPRPAGTRGYRRMSHETHFGASQKTYSCQPHHVKGQSEADNVNSLARRRARKHLDKHLDKQHACCFNQKIDEIPHSTLPLLHSPASSFDYWVTWSRGSQSLSFLDTGLGTPVCKSGK